MAAISTNTIFKDMPEHQKILNFISTIRESHPKMTDIFTQGSCYNFYLILRQIWPKSQPFYNINHIVTLIDNRYYDITGDVTNKVDKNYSYFFNIYSKNTTRKAIKQMTRAYHKF